MISFDKQTSKELEFQEIREFLSSYCKSEKGKQNALKISCFSDFNSLKRELEILKEVKTIQELGKEKLPHQRFSDINSALKVLRVENGVLIIDELLKVYELCVGTKRLIDFAKEHKTKYSLIWNACEDIERIDEVIKPIEEILDSNNKIKDNATKKLAGIRASMKSNAVLINRNFDQALRSYKKAEIIGDIEEAYLDNRRLLSVLSKHKKRVRGRVLGGSAGGSLSYIEPHENIGLNKEQEKLALSERNEIFAILAKITLHLRGEKPFIEAYERLLVRFDLMQAKILFAETYNGVIPKTTKVNSLHWENALHPLLYLKNKEKKIETIGQTISLKKEERFLIISGPNAGGKSITLKTIGLIQIMFQSGLLVPLNEVSECCWFDSILSDIGDNQSIEDQLSTYSYRLSRMYQFLEDANENTLLLLDEFGSGSDPELGGALAEVFFEELYESGCFAVMTTHYNNIKIKTAALDEAVNACMLFDTKDLKPLYHLSIGQPGSSFTFEVAHINGISEDLITKAKEKVSSSKMDLDRLTVSLQNEKSKLKRINTSQYQSKNEAEKQKRIYNQKLEKLSVQAIQQARYVEQQNKFLNAGKKVFDLIKKYKKHKTNKVLNEAINKYVAIEKQKAIDAEQPVVLEKELKAPKLPKSSDKVVLKEVEKAKNRSTESEQLEKPTKLVLKVGDKVRLKNQSGGGEVLEISGKKIKVLVGVFPIITEISNLEKS